MNAPSRTGRLRPLIMEGWIALVLAGFIWVRIAGSAAAHRIAHSFFSR